MAKKPKKKKNKKPKKSAALFGTRAVAGVATDVLGDVLRHVVADALGRYFGRTVAGESSTLRVPRLKAAVSLDRALSKTLELASVALERPVLRIVQTADGSVALPRRSAAPPAGGGRGWSVEVGRCSSSTARSASPARGDRSRDTNPRSRGSSRRSCGPATGSTLR